MKKWSLYIIFFLLIVSVFFIYNSYNLTREIHKLQKENQEINEGYDNNIMYAITLEDSIIQLKNELEIIKKSDKFSLYGNPKAHKYLNEISEINWEEYLIKKLLESNHADTKNPLIPYEGMEGKMYISEVKILNNRWLIARFTDGTYEGEMIIRYDINKDMSIDFKVIDQTLYGN